jgi:hypothetical protein
MQKRHSAQRYFLVQSLAWFNIWRNKAASHLEHHAVQVCGIFGVMMVPYFSAVVWGYQCQPFWQVGVPVVYYATAAIAAFSSTFAYSRMARCGTSVHCECLPCFQSVFLLLQHVQRLHS